MTDGPVDVQRRQADRAARHYAVGLLMVFAVLAALVVLRWPPMVALDLAGDLAPHAVVLREHLLVTVVTVVTDAGSPVSVNIITVLVAGYLLYRRRIGAAAYLVVARFVALGVQTAVKDLIARPRPALPDPVAHAGGFSFPSGHTTGTAVLCAALLVLALPTCRRRGPWIVLAGVAIAAVAASRVLLGVHYPSDVLGGAILGIACALIFRPLIVIAGPRAAMTATETERSA
jgi:undecaprenyl-diphosphatase